MTKKFETVDIIDFHRQDMKEIGFVERNIDIPPMTAVVLIFVSKKSVFQYTTCRNINIEIASSCYNQNTYSDFLFYFLVAKLDQKAPFFIFILPTYLNIFLCSEM